MRRMIKYALTALAVFLVGVSGSLRAEGVPTDLRFAEENGLYTIETRFEVRAPREVVWGVLADYDRIAQFVPSVESSRLFRRNEDYLLVEQRMKAGFFIFTKSVQVWLRVEEEPGRRIVFSDTSSKDFEQYSGSWELLPGETPEATVVVYRLQAKPKFSTMGTANGVLRKKAQELASAIAAEAESRALRDQQRMIHMEPPGRLWIEGRSTMHGWSTETDRLCLRLVVNGSAALPATEADWQKAVTERRVRRWEVAVPVLSLKSEYETLDEKLYEAMKAQEHPYVRFVMLDYWLQEPPAPAEGTSGVAGQALVRARGLLTIAGVERPVTLDVTLRYENGGIHLTGSKPIRMTEFGIKPPTMFLGTLKVQDEVTVHFDLAVAANLVTACTLTREEN